MHAVTLNPTVARVRQVADRTGTEREGTMFEPPMERCPVCGEYVVLVQTQQECAGRQQCGKVDACPLKSTFATTDFYRTTGDAAALSDPGR